MTVSESDTPPRPAPRRTQKHSLDILRSRLDNEETYAERLSICSILLCQSVIIARSSS